MVGGEKCEIIESEQILKIVIKSTCDADGFIIYYIFVKANFPLLLRKLIHCRFTISPTQGCFTPNK